MLLLVSAVFKDLEFGGVVYALMQFIMPWL